MLPHPFLTLPHSSIAPCCPPSLKPDGEKDPASLHGSCPTTGGVKWSATKWIHTGKFKA